MGCICIAYINDNINVIQKLCIIQNILETDKLHIKRSAGKRLYNSRVEIVLFLIKRMMYHMISPGAHLTPAVQYSYFLHTIRNTSLNIVIQRTELICDRFYVINKLREIQRKF